MEELLVLLGILLVIGGLVIPIMTFINASQVSKLHQKIKELEKRVQQQGWTLKELYEKLGQERPANAPQETVNTPYEEERAYVDQPPITQAAFSGLSDDLENRRPSAVTAQAAARNIPADVVTTSAFTDEVVPLEEIQETEVFSTQPQEEVFLQHKANQRRQWRKPPTQKRKPRFKLPSISGFLDQAVNYVKQWFKTGNVPVKIGVLVLFAGVASLLNYATSQGWINFSMQAKLVGISALSIAAFVFAWLKREKHRAFSLSVQGGSIGILLLTVFAAFKLYSFIPAGMAFGLTILLIAFTGVLAVMQNAMILAIFAVLAGFMAPIWLSTGSNNHVALFSYYAILNAGILGMSWYRPWRYLNLLGFAFTFGIGALWGVDYYRPEKFATTEPFLLLFFLFYLFIPILYARKYNGELRNKVDAALVFGTPLIAFSLQAVLLEDNRYALAGCAFGLGLIYFALKFFLARKEYLKEFAPAYLALGMGFTTLAVPLAFSAQQTSCIYALEGAALIWWGGRQSRLLSRLSGVALQVLASFTFVFTLGSLTREVGDWAIVNATFINLLILSGAAFFSAWCYRQQSTDWFDQWMQKRSWTAFSISHFFYIWGLFWWVVAGVREIYVFSAVINRADFAILFAVLTAWLAAEANKKWTSYLLGVTSMAGLCLPLLFAFWQNNLHATPLMGLGWLAWGTYIVLGVRSIMLWRTVDQRNLAVATQLMWWPTLTLVATLTLSWMTQRLGWSRDLSSAIMALPLLMVLALSLWRWRVVCLPLGSIFDKTRNYFQLLYFGAGMVVWCVAMLLPANNGALPWIPLFNPIELLQMGFAYMLWVWLKRQKTQPWFSEGTQGVCFAAMGLLMLSVITLRAIHHWGGISWNESILSHPLALRYLGIVWCFVTVAASRHAVRNSIVGLQECCLVLQAAAAVAFIKSWGLVTALDGPIFNLDYLGMLALSLAGLVTAWWYLYYEKTQQHTERSKALAFYIWGLLWWCGSIWYEVRQLSPEYQYGVLIALSGATGWFASKVYDHKPTYERRALAITVTVCIGIGLLLNTLQIGKGEHLLTLSGALGWLVFAGFTWMSIANIRKEGKTIAKTGQLFWWAWVALSASIELGWGCKDLLHLSSNSAWYQGGVVLPWLLLLAASIWRWNFVRMPLGVGFDCWRNGLLRGMFILGGVVWAGALFLPSNVSPLLWLPVLNPIDLLQLSFVGMVFYELKYSGRSYERWLTKHHQVLLLSIVGFAITSVITLRGVHHWGGVNWDAQIITDRLTQTSLSILWSVLGVVAWVWGSRKNQRLVWWGGAILMGIVLAKLLLIDRQELGNMLGIVSFIGYGLLCVVVGYLAPAPPKEVLNEDEKSVIEHA